MAAETRGTVRNWFGDLEQHPAVIVMARNAGDIVAVMEDVEAYPAPVRAIGSNHSTTECGFADGSTIVDMSQMTGVIEIADDTVTARAGALYIDVAKALEKRGLQLSRARVNPSGASGAVSAS